MAGRGMVGTGRREGSEGKKNGIAHPLVFALDRQPNLYTDAKNIHTDVKFITIYHM